ncbi:MAG: HAD-IB family hydrolase [Ilumatobacteraceae bacterium]|nr:HAD-IB family hydrolase [Ilumatobacteraceae bacterium]
MSVTTVAAFDFDETLTKRDTVVPFLRRFTTSRRFAVSLLPHTLRLLPIATRRDRDRLRALATDIVFRDRPIEGVDAEAASWGVTIAETLMRADTVARLQWHLAQDHRVVIVTASYEQYVRVVADVLGGVEVAGTRLEVVDGRCTGRLDGPNCRGPEKVRRLDEWLAGHGWCRDEVTLYAYGDSTGDRELLAAADHPHWVTAPLASVAP